MVDSLPVSEQQGMLTLSCMFAKIRAYFLKFASILIELVIDLLVSISKNLKKWQKSRRIPQIQIAEQSLMILSALPSCAFTGQVASSLYSDHSPFSSTPSASTYTQGTKGPRIKYTRMIWDLFKAAPTPHAKK